MNFNINSCFKYEDAKNYFKSLTCKSDNDCPNNAYCIGNKCIVSFYCKDGDNSICALSVSPTSKCFKNDSFIEYSVGHFTYNDSKKYFENLDIPCGYNNPTAVCPKYTNCNYYIENNGSSNVLLKQCSGTFYCKNKNTCSFSPIIEEGVSVVNKHKCKNYNFFKNNCITNNCKENYCNKVNRAEISKKITRYGFENGELCWRNRQCFSDYCLIDKVVIGHCTRPSDSDGVYVILQLFFLFIFYIFLRIFGSYRRYIRYCTYFFYIFILSISIYYNSDFLGIAQLCLLIIFFEFI